ncbi:MAG: ATP-dependent Clp protease proteolytic subunit [Chlamydiota bacterium]
MTTPQTSDLKTLDDIIENSLLEQRRIIFNGPVDNDSAHDAIRKLQYLEYLDPTKPILVIINSPGGSIDAGFAVWDQIQMMNAPITTMVTGIAASMGSILSLAAPKGRRFSTPNARIMIHQPALHGVVEGQATDLEIQATEILKTRDRIINLYVEATGRSFEVVEKAIDRDHWMAAKEAQEFGLIDKVVNKFSEI